VTELFRSMFRRRGRAAEPMADAGFAMLTVVGYGVVIVLVAALLAVYVLHSVSGARREQDFDGAITAAQAGVDNVVATLRANPAAAATLGNADWTAVPGSTNATGAPCEGHPTIPVNCPQFKYQTAYNSANGDVTVTAAGQVKGRNSTERAVKVTLHQATYTDYLYYSEVEAADPADPFAYPRLFYPNGAPPNCGLRAWAANPGDPTRPASCKVPLWRNGDSTNGSTVHSNDLFQTQGSPTYDSLVTTAYAGCKPAPSNPTPVCYTSATGSTPNFERGNPSYATGLVTAPNNLRSAATTAGCVYTGPTRIKFVGNQMKVWSPQTQASDNPGRNCGGGPAQNIVDQINAAFSLKLGTLTLNATAALGAIGLDQLVSAVTSIASDPAPVPVPAAIYVRSNDGTPVRAGATAPPPTSGLYCLLGKTLGLYGTLDPDPKTLVTNPEAVCNAGRLYVDGAFNGRSTIGTDDAITIVSDLYYSNASGSSSPGSDHTDGSSLGLVATGPVEVWNPLQCTIALATCLSLSPANALGNFTPLKALGGDVYVEAAIMSLQRRFGTSFPLLQPSAYASLLNALATLTVPTPKLRLYGSIAQYYRGAIGANLLNLGVGVTGASTTDPSVDHVDLASANVDVGYNAAYTYDQHLRSAPPPNFPTPAAATWVQDTFAEIPLSKLPNGF